MSKVYLVIQTYEDKNAIREFDIRYITSEYIKAQTVFNKLRISDTYGFFTTNGVEFESKDLIISNYDNGFEQLEIKEMEADK